MKCRDVYLHICENLDQGADSPRCRQIRRHLEACSDCASYLDSLKKTVDLYRALPDPRIPRGAHLRLFKIIKTINRGETSSPRRLKKTADGKAGHGAKTPGKRRNN